MALRSGPRSEERRVGKGWKHRMAQCYSSRRRHTRCLSDWSSDVCSSDLQVADSDAVKRPLEELGRERCDQSAIGNLGTALEKAGYRREAAVAQVTFSQSCGGHGASLRAAANVLLKLSDYPAAEAVASDSGYYLRGFAYD